jgi:hypothetical protein
MQNYPQNTQKPVHNSQKPRKTTKDFLFRQKLAFFSKSWVTIAGNSIKFMVSNLPFFQPFYTISMMVYLFYFGGF